MLVDVRVLRLLRIFRVFKLTTAQRRNLPTTTRTCHQRLTEGHAPEALHCLHCGAKLPPYEREA